MRQIPVQRNKKIMLKDYTYNTADKNDIYYIVQYLMMMKMIYIKHEQIMIYKYVVVSTINDGYEETGLIFVKKMLNFNNAFMSRVNCS